LLPEQVARADGDDRPYPYPVDVELVVNLGSRLTPTRTDSTARQAASGRRLTLYLSSMGTNGALTVRYNDLAHDNFERSSI
jgi:hypothetical protein